MAIEQGMCTSCNALIEVNTIHDAEICRICNNAFIVQKAIEKYKACAFNSPREEVKVDIFTELEQMLLSAEGVKRNGNIRGAFEIYQKVSEKYPRDIRGWIGCMHCYLQGEFVKSDPTVYDADWILKEPFSRWYSNACILASDEEKQRIENQKNAYVDAVNRKRETLRSEMSLSALKQQIGNAIFYKLDYDNIPHASLYVRNNKVFYQVDGPYGAYATYEITDVNKNGELTVQLVEAFANTFFLDSTSENKARKEFVKRQGRKQLKIFTYDRPGTIKMMIDGYEDTLYTR